MTEIKTAVFHPDDAQTPYREGVVLVVVNTAGKIFIGERTTVSQGEQAWQLPQGGIKATYQGEIEINRETIEQAAQRECREELGASVIASIASISVEPLFLNYNDDFNPKYRGQRLQPVLMFYQGGDVDISRLEDGDTKPAFSAYRWIEPQEFLVLATESKRDLYEKILNQFASSIKQQASQNPHAPVPYSPTRVRLLDKA